MVPANFPRQFLLDTHSGAVVEAERSTITLQLHCPEQGPPWLLWQGKSDRKLMHEFLRLQSVSYTYYFLSEFIG